MNRKIILLVAAIITAGAVTGFALFNSRPANADFAMTELQVLNLSCGSCVSNIQGALGDIDGVQTVDVSLTSGRSQVVHDPGKVDGARIAQVVTDAGYPASVLRQLTTDQFKNLKAEDARLAEIYIAKIGKTLLSRDDFEHIVDQYISANVLQNQSVVRAQVRTQVWPILLQRTLMLNDAERNNIVVQTGEVELQIEQMRQRLPNFDAYIQSRYGSLEMLSQKLREDMTIDRHVEQNVLAGISEPQQRQAEFGRWHQQLVTDTPIQIYDTELKQASSAGSGCGSGCCSKSS